MMKWKANHIQSLLSQLWKEEQEEEIYSGSTNSGTSDGYLVSLGKLQKLSDRALPNPKMTVVFSRGSTSLKKTTGSFLKLQWAHQASLVWLKEKILKGFQMSEGLWIMNEIWMGFCIYLSERDWDKGFQGSSVKFF